MELTEQQKLEILCAYLPYGIEVEWIRPDDNEKIVSELTISDYSFLIRRHSGKPILRHQDDMSEVELSELGRILWNDKDLNKNIARENAKDWLKGSLKITLSPKWAQSALQYLHSIHIDTFGAIEAGFAIRKTN
jgi:hypothetical protein